MPRARSELVDVASTPWYHVVSRCVRRAFLCGEDGFSGRSYEHRRGWLTDRIKQLAGVFAIDVAAYAVMSNHFHLVLHVDVDRARAWSVDEVLGRWTRVFAGPEVVQQYVQDPDVLAAAQVELVHSYAETYRARLADLSWYMRVLNESIARMANAEDGVTGRFWEGRFKSQALLDEAGVLTAMAYVDLNPIRAKLAATPEESEYTSVAERLAALMSADLTQASAEPAPKRSRTRSGQVPMAPATVQTPASERGKQREQKVEGEESVQKESRLAQLPLSPLMAFDATGRLEAAIPFALEDYLELVEASGRVIRENKRGFIAGQTPKLLDRLHIDPEQFIVTSTQMLRQFTTVIGTPEHIQAYCLKRQHAYLRGISSARELYPQAA